MKRLRKLLGKRQDFKFTFLGDTVKVCFVDSLDHGAIGRCKTRRCRATTWEAEINLVKDNDRHENDLLGTFIHEMIHFFLRRRHILNALQLTPSENESITYNMEELFSEIISLSEENFHKFKPIQKPALSKDKESSKEVTGGRK